MGRPLHLTCQVCQVHVQLYLVGQHLLQQLDSGLEGVVRTTEGETVPEVGDLLHQ